MQTRLCYDTHGWPNTFQTVTGVTACSTHSLRCKSGVDSDLQAVHPVPTWDGLNQGICKPVTFTAPQAYIELVAQAKHTSQWSM
jgi:hypothetical protein